VKYILLMLAAVWHPVPNEFVSEWVVAPDLKNLAMTETECRHELIRLSHMTAGLVKLRCIPLNTVKPDETIFTH